MPSTGGCAASAARALRRGGPQSCDARSVSVGRGEKGREVYKARSAEGGYDLGMELAAGASFAWPSLAEKKSDEGANGLGLGRLQLYIQVTLLLRRWMRIERPTAAASSADE